MSKRRKKNLKRNSNTCISRHTFDSLHKSGSEKQVSSKIISDFIIVIASQLNTTAAKDDVKTTLFIEGDFVHDLRTFSVPSTAGSISSFYNIVEQKQKLIKLLYRTMQVNLFWNFFPNSTN